MKDKRIPKHVAIIMDGNGRWAKQHHLPRTQGHIEGAKRAEEVVDFANSIGVKVLTLFAFSTENWHRPDAEISMLMNLLKIILNKKIDKFKNNNLQFQTIGVSDNVPIPILETINKVKEETKNNNGLIINLAFNYGARREIVDAIKDIAYRVKNGNLNINEICENTVSDALYTKMLPDPDLLIRTSGEQRISNFLLWQLSYTELYFTDKYWPEFTKEEFEKAISDYQKRERRFGSITATMLKRE